MSQVILTTETQWIIVDSKVFDLSKFMSMHPGGVSVLLDEEIGVWLLGICNLA